LKRSRSGRPRQREGSKEAFQRIPWASFGRESAIARLAKSIVPVGNRDIVLGSPDLFVSSNDPDFESHIMEIRGTAFQVGKGKLVTCWHVCEELEVANGRAHIQAHSRMHGRPAKRYYPVLMTMNFIDPRTDAGNPSVDVGLIICPAAESPEVPYDVPKVRWGDSTKLGVGDRVLIGGFPLGRDLFLTLATNRGIVQPTFYDGIISAILPAVREGETRLLQISSVAVGGISGGVVCNPVTGEVLGMVTSGMTANGVSLPMTYAVPSEVLEPWCDSISFNAADGKRWR
jgi:Trypsin-like peptidase domain